MGCEKVASMGCHARRQWARGQSVKAGLSRLMPLEGVNVRVDCGPASGACTLGSTFVVLVVCCPVLDCWCCEHTELGCTSCVTKSVLE